MQVKAKDICNCSFKPVQRAAISLIQNDLKYLYTVIKKVNPNASNYIPSLQPYMGVIIDGVEDWIKSFNNSSKIKLEMPLFTENEQIYYEEMRNSIKMWQRDYTEIYELLQYSYKRSDEYFSNICKPIAKQMKWYDIFGVDRANGVICGNTILCQYYSPRFSFGNNNGVYIKTMAEIGGKYIWLFDATEEYMFNDMINFDTKDYGGFQKSPVGNHFSDKFVLFSILCQINFVIHCVDNWIQEEVSTKLRFAYLLYYSLLHIIPQINSKIGINLYIDPKWQSREFRNAMAHYKLGVALKEIELIIDDTLFGLTQKYFNEDYLTVKQSIIFELKSIAFQIGEFLGLENSMVN